MMHCNINRHGDTCIDITDNWAPNKFIKNVLIEVVQLLRYRKRRERGEGRGARERRGRGEGREEREEREWRGERGDGKKTCSNGD